MSAIARCEHPCKNRVSIIPLSLSRGTSQILIGNEEPRSSAPISTPPSSSAKPALDSLYPRAYPHYFSSAQVHQE